MKSKKLPTIGMIVKKGEFLLRKSELSMGWITQIATCTGYTVQRKYYARKILHRNVTTKYYNKMCFNENITVQKLEKPGSRDPCVKTCVTEIVCWCGQNG